MIAPQSERNVWRGATWEIQVFYPAPGVLYTRASGHATLEAAHHAMRAFDRLAALTVEKIEAFHDWEGITGYDAEVRSEYTRWSKSHVERLGGVHVMVRSRLVAMAVTLVSAAVGGKIYAYNDRSAFEKLRAEAIVRRRRQSEPPPPPSGPLSSQRISRGGPGGGDSGG